MRTASLAARNGYGKVYVYTDGLPDWEKHGYPVESDVTYPDTDIGTISGAELREAIDAGADLLVLDVRDAADFALGRIGAAVNIALDDMQERWEDLPRTRKIVLVDRHGKQVRNSARYLAYRGLTNLAMLEKGFFGGWKDSGYPVEEGP